MGKDIRVRERHFAVDILSSAAGGAFIASVIQKSWLCAAITVILIVPIYIFDKIGIENEEKLED